MDIHETFIQGGHRSGNTESQKQAIKRKKQSNSQGNLRGLKKWSRN